VLKEESIRRHRAWVAAGRPRDGPCACEMRKARAEYKLYLKHKRKDEQCCFTNDLHDALIDKDTVSFWKTWNAKFCKKFNNRVINGLHDHGSIADVFAQSYAVHAQPNNSVTNANLEEKFKRIYDTYTGDEIDCETRINVELVDNVVRNLKRARAAGITAEHLIYSHPVLCVLLSLLFRLIMLFSYVPDAFGLGMIIPLLKGDNDSSVADNYRAITISSCISKAFEMCLDSVFHPWLGSDELQFGFKKGRGCRDAVYTLRGIISHINAGGSTAVLCALDVSKAFDKMNHYGLYINLMDRNIPKCFLDVLICWYSKCYAFVRWGSYVSEQFKIMAGVRQGGVLSPVLFSVFINTVICKLRSAGYGAYIGMYFFGCLLYADDVLLVSHSIFDMQLMLNICSQEADTLDFTFNTSKSVAIRIGPNYRRVCAPLHLCNSPLVYVDQVKYLGILLLSARVFKCSFDQLKMKF